jgi:flagellar basal-body rod protein FlgG
MKNGIYSAAAGMLTSQERLDIAANNLANVNTTGFKEVIPFEQVLKYYQDGPFPGKEQPIVGGTAINPANGTITITGNPLDLAMQSPAFFVAKSPDGSQFYTRNGAFQLSSQRQLVTAEGVLVMDKFDKPIDIIGDQFYFTPKGDLIVDGNYYTSLKIMEVNNINDLEIVGHNLFRLKNTASTPKEVQNVNLVVGGLEQSNVNVVEELNNLIIIQRSFEFQQKGLDMVLQNITRAITDVAKPI